MVAMPLGDFLLSALGCLSDQTGDPGPLGVSGQGQRRRAVPTLPAGRACAATVPSHWACGCPWGACRKGMWGTWGLCGWHMEGDRVGVTAEVRWRTCGEQAGTGGQWRAGEDHVRGT